MKLATGQGVDWYFYGSSPARGKPRILPAVIRRVLATKIAIAVEGETRERFVAAENLKLR